MSQELIAAWPRTASRQRVLAVVRASPSGCRVPEVARRAALHPSTARFHLERLERDGLISRQTDHSGKPGRPPLAYIPNPVPDAGREHREFAQLAEVLAQQITQSSTDAAAATEAGIQAGRSWGLTITEEPPAPADVAEALDTLAATLSEIGFVPETEVTPQAITLLQHHCPFLEVAQNHQDVVCSVHLGLIRGVLQRIDAPVSADSLVPFARPTACEANLSINR